MTIDQAFEKWFEDLPEPHKSDLIGLIGIKIAEDLAKSMADLFVGFQSKREEKKK